ncbi:porin [Moraxella nasibovis]|uniref:porin n=1 Tax=Moraxella nasibovis TaxID=2904120 RepID=UPI002410988C|nr:porin [Moraxella nasibovis]WFF39317.1 porin [Moraxella nasibovis]
MKKLLLASAVAALSITAAQAAPTVYGKAFLTLDVQDGDNVSTVLGDYNARTQLNSNASRIGLKGSEALTQNTDLVYQLEYGVKVDDNSTQFTSRDTYLGLANKQYGTLVAGRLTAIDDYVNYANVTQGGVVGGDNVLATFDAPRANNAFAYFSPERNGVQFMAMYAMDELNNTTAQLDIDGNKINVTRDIAGIGAKYEPTNAPYKVGATYIQAGDALKAVRVSGAYALSPVLTAGALYQHTDYDTDNNENAFTVSANYKVAQTPWTAYGQLDLVDNVAGLNNSEKQRIAVGGKYAFNQATTGHIYGALLQREVAGVDADAYGIGGGIEYKF